MSDKLLASIESVQTVDEFKHWTRTHLRSVLPHGALTCGLGHLHAGGVGLDYLVTVDYPVQHIEAIRNRAGAIDTPILRRWLMTQQPVHFDADDPWPDTPANWLSSFRRHRLQNVLADAMYDTDRCVGTYHSVYRIPARPDERHIGILRSLVPVLHEALCRVIGHAGRNEPLATDFAVLSAREREVLRWLKLGKTNAEIARLLALSEHTVKHHLTRVFGKLGVPNRAHLVRRLTEHEVQQMPGRITKVL
jgi:transcriptional regulator EpsA